MKHSPLHVDHGGGRINMLTPAMRDRLLDLEGRV